MSNLARAAAGLIALIASIGVLVQFDVTFAQLGSVGATLWKLLGFFTILTNLVVAVLFAGIALNKPVRGASRWLPGVMLATLLVGVVYYLLLRTTLTGAAAFANFILHDVIPILVPLYWLAFVPKGGIQTRDPLLWAAYPTLYFIYASARGMIDGHYAYSFIDAGKIGWPRTIENAVMIAAGFICAGYAVLGFDRLLAGGKKH